MNTTKLAPKDLPGFYNEHSKPVVHKRNAKLIQDNNGQIMLYRDLPKPAQYAIAHYMAIDGEAWAIEDELQAFWDDYWKKSNDLRKATARFKPLFESKIDFYINRYGKKRFGLVSIPLPQLIEAVKLDTDAPVDFYQSIGERAKYGEKHNFTDWASILSDFDEETLQDGWTRFFNSVRAGDAERLCVWYPRGRKS